MRHGYKEAPHGGEHSTDCYESVTSFATEGKHLSPVFSLTTVANYEPRSSNRKGEHLFTTPTTRFFVL